MLESIDVGSAYMLSERIEWRHSVEKKKRLWFYTHLISSFESCSVVFQSGKDPKSFIENDKLNNHYSMHVSHKCIRHPSTKVSFEKSVSKMKPNILCDENYSCLVLPLTYLQWKNKYVTKFYKNSILALPHKDFGLSYSDWKTCKEKKSYSSKEKLEVLLFLLVLRFLKILLLVHGNSHMNLLHKKDTVMENFCQFCDFDVNKLIKNSQAANTEDSQRKCFHCPNGELSDGFNTPDDFNEDSISYAFVERQYYLTLHKVSSPPIQLPPDFPHGDVKQELFRLRTFENFPPNVQLNCSLLAKSGFFFTGRNNFVQCFSCHNVTSAQTSHNPFDFIMHRSNCAFQRRESGCGNIPLSGAFGPFDSGFESDHYIASNIRSEGRPIATPLLSQIYQSAQPAGGPVTAPQENETDFATIHSSSFEQFLRSLNLCRESDRLKTFAKWPASFSRPCPQLLAKSGFFYLGNLDRTQCFECGGVLRDWNMSDNVDSEHLQKFSHCVMAQGLSTKNIPVISSETQVQSAQSSYDFELTEERKRNLRDMFPCENAITPQMTDFHHRLSSFRNWNYTRATRDHLAEAGFFSLDVRDRTKCYYCNGGLQNWHYYDDPWEEHAKWYPTCEYLLRCKGPDYVHSVVVRYPNLNRPVLRTPGKDVPPRHRSLVNNHNTPSTSAVQDNVSENPSEIDQVDLLAASLKSDVARTVAEMGYSWESVKEVSRRRIAIHGKAYEKAVDLLEAVTTYEDESITEINSIQQNAPIKVQSQSSEQNLPLTNGLTNVTDMQTTSEDKYSRNKQTNKQTHHTGNKEIEASSSLSRASNNSIPTEHSRQPSHVIEANKAEEAPEEMQTTSPSTSLNHERVPSTSNGVDDPTTKHLLQSKFEEMLDEQLCKVCLDRKKEILFFPCNHFCCCKVCAEALRSCPLCRRKIQKGMRIYTT